jgi:GNAT superfamily N-acetyltransferase
VIPDPESRFHHIYCFLHNQSVIIAISMDHIDVFREQAANWTQADILDEQRLRSLIGVFFGRIIGPAFIGYTDRATFHPATGKAVRFLESNDSAALEALRAACSALEWEHGGSKLEGAPVAGAFADGQLVAVAGYKSWGSLIAHLSVIAHPLYRGQGYGRAVVSELTEDILKQALIPQYQTLHSNLSSMAIGRALGFERYATTVTVRLKTPFG